MLRSGKEFFMKGKKTSYAKRYIATLLLISILSASISCGEQTESKDTETSSEATTMAVSEEYTYPDKDFGGYEFTIYNADVQFGCNIRVDSEEQTGEALNDAIYERNRRVENKFGCLIREFQADASAWGDGQRNMCKTISQMVMAGDSDYDAAYLPIYFSPSVVTENYLEDLYTIPELQLDEKYWDNVINNDLTLNGHLYTASSPLNFMSLDLAWVLLFNQNMMDDMNIEYPYDLVREGKWTLDALNTLVSSVASLNGDDSFSWDPDGNSIYGIANHVNAPSPFLFSAGNSLMTRENGSFKFTADNEHMYSTVEKLITILNQLNGNAYSESSSGADFTKRDGYLYAFFNDRSLFISCELKSTLELRSMSSDFGLVPMPKYDENQENYLSYVNPVSCFLTVPITNPDKERTGIILDALTYDSYKNCLSVYYDLTVSYKGLRNDDSIEMLQIIRDNRSTQLTNLFGITSDLDSRLQSIIVNGNNTAASTIAAAKESVTANLDEVLNALNG